MEISDSDHTFELNEPQVVCESIEGDLVLVHFESGLYYSIRGTGADVYRSIISGVTLSNLTVVIANHYQIHGTTIKDDIRRFVLGLIEERILLVKNATGPGASGDDYDKLLTTLTYEAPKFEKFDDMADQLLLDKIDDDTQQAVWVTDAVVVGP